MEVNSAGAGRKRHRQTLLSRLNAFQSQRGVSNAADTPVDEKGGKPRETQVDDQGSSAPSHGMCAERFTFEEQVLSHPYSCPEDSRDGQAAGRVNVEKSDLSNFDLNQASQVLLHDSITPLVVHGALAIPQT